MNKQNRGDAPPVPQVYFHKGQRPLLDEVRQGGFEQNNEGLPSPKLREHNGCHATWAPKKY